MASDANITPLQEIVARQRYMNPPMDEWAAGYGVINHSLETQVRIHEMAERLKAAGIIGDGLPFFEVLSAADRLASAAMWLVVHLTYADYVFLDGRELRAVEFKPTPEGHTGGALNMVPAYVGYIAINALTGITRSWLMGQGHAVAAIDTVNLLLGNVGPAHAQRYSVTHEGLTRFARDFYSYLLNERGEPDSPLGSHVNVHTAGGMMEGGYLGFAELQYMHMPLPDERLVVFLSDGAFEEQRGSDWAPRWWHTRDSGIVAPIMIANGRRIDQRTTLSQQGGVEWLCRHLELNSFDPIIFDGRDPAAFVWAIFEIESRLQAESLRLEQGRQSYPVRLPYGIAVSEKGFGFYDAGTNLAHNLPLGTNPHTDGVAAARFNESARKLWVRPIDLRRTIERLTRHHVSNRPLERDHPLAHRNVSIKGMPQLLFMTVDRTFPSSTAVSPMDAIDASFVSIVEANPQLRPRVGNPDEMKSNRMLKTLAALKFRVTDPEPSVPEALGGAVVTALNEEAVVSAALANKAGINIVVTYEAFAVKMLGALRQEIIFAAALKESGRPAQWLSVPIVLTSHTYENGKNELSHQDPTMAEALMAESSDISRVIFPADYNSATAAMRTIYSSRGEFWGVVTPKREVPVLLDQHESEQLCDDGAIELEWAGLRKEPFQVILTAIGAYQLTEVLKASERLIRHGIAHHVVYMFEPGRFRMGRNEAERKHLVSSELVRQLYPEAVPARVFVAHTRPESILGILRPLDTGPAHTIALGFQNRGGTLDVNGMLFVNQLTWAHCLVAVAKILAIPRQTLLNPIELDALEGRRSPQGVLFPLPGGR